MTEFEQAVAQALEASVKSPCPSCEAHAKEFAPRVAAAIAAAGKVAIRTAEDGDRARAAALAALRGETG